MEKCIIVAMSKNNVIGCNNQIPWHLPEDLKRFKKITMGHPIIMGRKTFDSIGNVLPGRENIIVSANIKYIKNAIVCPSLEDAIRYCEMKKYGKIFFIGGQEIYKQSIHLADLLYLTIIEKEISGDRFFPKVNYHNYNVESLEDHSAHPEYPYLNLTLRKKDE